MTNIEIEKIKKLIDNVFDIVNVEDNYKRISNILKNNSKGNKEIIHIINNIKSIDKRMDSLLRIEVWQRAYATVILTEDEISEKLYKDIIGKDSRIDKNFETTLKKRAYIGFRDVVDRIASNIVVQYIISGEGDK